LTSTASFSAQAASRCPHRPHASGVIQRTVVAGHSPGSTCGNASTRTPAQELGRSAYCAAGGRWRASVRKGVLLKYRASLIVAVLALSLAGSPAFAAPPTLVSVGRIDRHPTATWTLPPGVESRVVEVATSPATASDGYFFNENVVASTFLSRRTRHGCTGSNSNLARTTSTSPVMTRAAHTTRAQGASGRT
jgi:hypothetical protein